MKASPRRWILGFALLGLIGSSASSYVHYRLLSQPGYDSFCDVSATVSCTEAYLSRYGSFGGVPVAILGAIFFAFVLVLVLFGSRGGRGENVAGYLFALSTAALGVVLYLAYASFFVLKAVCLLCVVTYIAVIGLFIVAGAATTFPMTTLPKRALRDLRLLATSPFALVVTILFVAGAASAVAFFPREESSTPTTQQKPPTPIPDDRRSEFERWYSTLSPVNLPVDKGGAKVLVVKFNDYQCPPCRQSWEAYGPIFAKYEASNPGGVKFVVKDYPLETECNFNVASDLHPAACEAAVAVRLAREHKRGEAMEQWLFSNQKMLSPAAVKTAARDVGQVQDFDARYTKMIEQVKSDISLGGSVGVRSTPTFFINGKLIPNGWLPPPFFDAALAYEIKQAGQ